MLGKSQSRRVCTFGFAAIAVPLLAQQSMGQVMTAAGTPTAPSALSTGTITVGMPATTSQRGSNLQVSPSPGGPQNLGSFDIVINASGALQTNAAALAAFNRAAEKWEALIADPITVTINADFSALGPGILGSASSVILSDGYTNVRNAMVADAADEFDDAIVASLPTINQAFISLPQGFGLNGNLSGTKANFKALGYTGLDAAFGAADANIAFSTAFAFDFDNSNGVSPGQTDFEGVAAHEIGHALGFISEVDTVDFVLPGVSAQIEPSTLDMFRFRNGSANDPATAANFTTFTRDLVPGAAGIFDQVLADANGSSLEVLMSTGVDFGDGNQASHFKDNLGLGIMDPTAAAGEFLAIQPNDVRAFDLIGYDIVPEPTSLALLATAGLLGARRRRK